MVDGLITVVLMSKTVLNRWIILYPEGALVTFDRLIWNNYTMKNTRTPVYAVSFSKDRSLVKILKTLESLHDASEYKIRCFCG